jgi:hypothetical protein
MRILFWSTIILSFLYTASVLTVRIFITKTTIYNSSHKSISITPFGRIRSTTTTTIPLEFKLIGISNPFNKQILIEPYRSIDLYYDLDICCLDGYYIFENDSVFRKPIKNSNLNSDTIYESNLKHHINLNSNQYKTYSIKNFIPFTIRVISSLYGPCMIILFLRRKQIRIK